MSDRRVSDWIGARCCERCVGVHGTGGGRWWPRVYRADGRPPRRRARPGRRPPARRETALAARRSSPAAPTVRTRLRVGPGRAQPVDGFHRQLGCLGAPAGRPEAVQKGVVQRPHQVGRLTAAAQAARAGQHPDQRLLDQVFGVVWRAAERLRGPVQTVELLGQRLRAREPPRTDDAGHRSRIQVERGHSDHLAAARMRRMFSSEKKSAGDMTAPATRANWSLASWLPCVAARSCSSSSGRGSSGASCAVSS